MSLEANKSIVRRYLEEIINRGDFAVADEIIAPAYVNHSAGSGIGTGRDNYLQGLRAVRTAFPDWHVTIEEVLADGEFVTDRITIDATHTGSVNGVAPTGRRIVATLGMHMWRLVDGRLVEGWYVSDVLRDVAAALTPEQSSR
ncbi:MAG TPA: ester cyclase [Thermomicrobiaceae bacterium]|nr:ester cyclase [Thermomicrobiaceae bacterium]